MEGQLRPGLRADDEVVTVAVLGLTVVPEEVVVVVVEAAAMAEGAWGSLAEGSTFRWIFSTLTAGMSILSGCSTLNGKKGGFLFSLAGLRSLELEEETLGPTVEDRPRKGVGLLAKCLLS